MPNTTSYRMGGVLYTETMLRTEVWIMVPGVTVDGHLNI
jgi:hypothetical protein